MQLPGMYVVAMAQKERAWAINREWLVVTLTFVAAYLALWLIVALFTLAPGAAWVWPDPRRRESYRAVSIVCALLLAGAAVAVWFGDPFILVIAGVLFPLVDGAPPPSCSAHGSVGTTAIGRRSSRIRSPRCSCCSLQRLSPEPCSFWLRTGFTPGAISRIVSSSSRRGLRTGTTG